MIRNFKFALYGLIIISLTSCDSTPSKNTLSYEDLCNRITDLKALAVLPVDGENAAMWASYDRKSKYNEETGAYENWGANDDGYHPQYIRKELLNGDSVEVLAEMTGPGCINRIWSAYPRAGHVKIYIDSTSEPTIDISFEDFFSGSVSPFDQDELVYIAAQGRNNFTPIPYQKSCKIVADSGWGQYYQFNYTTFPKETQLPSFSMNLDKTSVAALKKVNSTLKNRGPIQPKTVEKGTVSIVSGESKTILEIEGEKAINFINIKTNFENKEIEKRALRKIALQISWDDDTEPAVWSPLGDFFGTSPGINYYKTLALGMTKEGMYSNFYMPFAKKAKIELINEDEQAHEISFEIGYEKLEQPIETFGRFHAKWHRDVNGIEYPNPERWPDWLVMRSEGKGRYVGMMLNIWSPRGGNCPGKEEGVAKEGFWWWGEGDEKFFVDGEKFPSYFGTGTEDYFGYAWCEPGNFEKALHSQTYGSSNMGYQTVSRIHTTDNVPFHTSFDGYLEKFFPNNNPVDYACVAYWYLSADGKEEHLPIAVENRFGFEQPFDYGKMLMVDGAIEAELLFYEPMDAKHICYHGPSFNMDGMMSRNQVSNFFNEIDRKISVKTELNVAEDGDYEFIVNTWNGLITPNMQFYIDGKEIGGVMEFFKAEPPFGYKEFSIGKISLSKGKHSLSFEDHGLHKNFEKKDEQTRKFFYVDYFKLNKIN